MKIKSYFRSKEPRPVYRSSNGLCVDISEFTEFQLTNKCLLFLASGLLLRDDDDDDDGVAGQLIFRAGRSGMQLKSRRTWGYFKISTYALISPSSKGVGPR